MTSGYSNLDLNPIKTFLARAIYDNVADRPSELNFSSGDLLTVLDQNPRGIDGWWICSLKGEIGIVPANRLELLGSIHRKTYKVQSNSDVYDDPNEWFIATNSNQKQKIPHQQQLTSPCIYENLDYYDKDNIRDHENNSIRQADSGNHSQRSSDNSLSLQPAQENNERNRSKLIKPYHDRKSEGEDMGSSLYMKAISPSDECDTTFHTTNDSNGTTISTIKSNSDIETTRDNIYKLESKYISMYESRMSSECNSSIKSRSDSTISSTIPKQQSGWIPQLPTTKSAFVEYWSPIQKCIELTIHLINNHPKSNQYDPILVTHLTNLDRDLLIICQLCTFLIGISKQCPDQGLTRKFISYRQNLENLADKLINYRKSYSHKGVTLINGELSRSISGILKSVQTEIALLHTTSMANSCLLFSPTQDSDVPKQEVEPAHSIKQQTNDVEVTNKSRLSAGCKRDNNKVKSTGCDMTCDLSLLRLESMTTKREHKQLSIVIKLDRKCNTEFVNLCQNCDNSIKYGQQFLALLTTLQTERVRTRSSLTVDAIIEQTKMIMSKFSEVLRSSTLICHYLDKFIAIRSSDQSNELIHLIKLRDLIESRADRICETLKGLLVQTKETTRYITSDGVGANPDKLLLHIPGPLLQRLTGAIGCVNSTTKELVSYMERYSVEELITDV